LVQVRPVSPRPFTPPPKDENSGAGSYAPGGKLFLSLIENFFGFPTGISGGDLTWLAQLQAYRSAQNFNAAQHSLLL